MIQQQQAQPIASGEAAGFGERLVAYIIDAVALGFVSTVLFVIMGGAPASRLLGFAFGLLYTIGFWSAGGATPGKMLMKLQIVRADGGGEIDVGTALLRYLGYFISGIALGLGFLSIIWDAEKRGWHDKIAGTRVIRVR